VGIDNVFQFCERLFAHFREADTETDRWMEVSSDTFEIDPLVGRELQSELDLFTNTDLPDRVYETTVCAEVTGS
jgi:hypothetical protein